MESPVERCFQTLPAELINAILSHLTPQDLSNTGSTCRLLYSHSRNDLLWQRFVSDNLLLPICPPADISFKDLYLAHYQHWFLTKHKIWFGDLGYTGRLIVALYNKQRRCIEAFSLAAQRAPPERGFVKFDGTMVLYNTFSPRVHLDLNRAQLRLDWCDPRGLSRPFRAEIEMDMQTANTHPFRHVFLHAKNLPSLVAEEPSVQVWPRRKIPAIDGHRIRVDSANCFRGADHVPPRLSQSSRTTFRIRQHIQSSNISRIPMLSFSQQLSAEIISNYGTLPAEAYTPTPEKPWQGIWCGDYNAHGVEFLLVTQPDNPTPLPPQAQRAFDIWPSVDPGDVDTLLYGGGDNDDDADEEDIGQTYRELAGMRAHGPSLTETETAADEAPYKGRLEAIKLTGDPNIPRGEYTFVAQDIGQKGLISCTQQDLFNRGSDAQAERGELLGNENHSVAFSKLPNRVQEGARVVRSIGHVAAGGFTRDVYIPTQLILVSENRLAQYWKTYQQMSFYQRVDIDALIARGYDS